MRGWSHDTAATAGEVPSGDASGLGIFSYTPELEAAINRGDHIPPGSAEEVEIRAHTLYATALLTDAINRIRPALTLDRKHFSVMRPLDGGTFRIVP